MGNKGEEEEYNRKRHIEDTLIDVGPTLDRIAELLERIDIKMAMLLNTVQGIESSIDSEIMNRDVEE